jgi:hypothetical protein
MKAVKVLLILLFLGASVTAFSDSIVLSDNFNSGSLGNWMPVSGSWRVMDGRMSQIDTKEHMAMITAPAYQSGRVLYEFDVEYIGGGEDDYAGFGFHICVSGPSSKRSWGNGKSMLAWVTWDPKAYGSPGGFIQVYESASNSSMGLYTGVYPGSDPLRYGDLIPINREYLQARYLSYRVPVKIMIDTRTGKGRFYDPFAPDEYYYPFDLGEPIRAGGYFTIRTNSVALSFDNVRITRLD